MKNKLSMDMVMKIFDDEAESMKKRFSRRIRRYFKYGNSSSADRRNMKLKFTNKIPDTILTCEEIKVEGDARLEVALVDDPSEKIVDVGPEASAQVQFVLLKGDDDDDEEEEFDQNIIPEIQGKKPLLDGDVVIRLERGVGVVQNVKLRNHAIKIKPAVFKLGARVVDFRVKEARTGAFKVKDYRNKYHTKHPNPSLSDEVSRLCNIAYCGKIYKRLQSNGINTVEDFLIRLLINRDELEKIVNMGPKKWEKTIKNARACSSETRMYCYVNLEQKKAVVFNVLGQAIGLYDSSHYSPKMNMLAEEEHKAYAEELLASAYKNWGDVKSFDDPDSLHHHLTTCLSPQDCRGDGHETIGETSSRRSYASFHSVNSAMDSVGGEDFSSFGTYDMDVETMYDADAVMYSPVDFEALFHDFDDFLQQRDAGRNEQLENEPINGDDGAAFVSESPNRWKNLLSRIFSLKKKGSVDAGHHHKKQKIG